MDYSDQKNYFETAYNTGSDIWTDKLYHSKVFEYLALLPADSMILDLGSGRGRLAFAMVELGFRVIGLDYIHNLGDVNNAEARAKNMQGKIKFIEGDVLDIAFADGSFDAVTDFALLQHMHREDWRKYSSEINRVLKSGGYILNVSLSKDTEQFYDFQPNQSIEGDYEKYGAFFHFFTATELTKVYGENFKLIKQETFYLEKERETLLITLLQKN